MLIPSIDVQGGRIVQLVQGERVAVETDDVAYWVDRFRPYGRVQLIDLDAAKGVGRNDALIARISGELPCRVGGGIRSIERAEEVLANGAAKVIFASALFSGDAVDVAFAGRLAERLGPGRVIAAVDSRWGQVVVNGWRRRLAITPIEAMRQLEPYADEFLYTNVDREGLLQGADLEAIRAVRAATTRAVTAAGGITTMEEVDYLQSIEVDAVVGMALYTGRL